MHQLKGSLKYTYTKLASVYLLILKLMKLNLRLGLNKDF